MTDNQSRDSLTETRRTVIYAVVAALSIVLGVSTYYSNQPKEMAEFEKVGEQFYPDFDDTENATSLFVATYIEDQGEVKTFEVEQIGGQWRIPSHYNYPADALEQFARTATSIMGVRREALISRRAADHEKLGVVDPLSEDASDRKGRGDRITIKKGNEVVADYIIGKSYPGEDGAFYVRAPDEQETFVAHIDVDLSTKFQDWIDTDLLKIDRNKLTEILVRKYSIDAETRRPSDLETVSIKREKFGEPWELEGLDTETEEVNHDAVKELVSALVDTKILGVRPKPEGLTPSLGLSQEVARNPLLQLTIQSDLQNKGYQLAQMESGELFVIANEGSFFAITNEGIAYELHFGDIFTGDLEEIEIGKPDEEEQSAEEASSDTAAETDSQDDENADSTGNDSSPAGGSGEDVQQSRYLFVKVNFDPAAIGPAPTPPEEPAEPGPFDPEAPLTAARPGEPDLTPQEEYERASKQYEADLKQYEADLEAHEEKLAQGKQKAKQLSDRLGAWYYVVPAEDVEALRVSRADLVQPEGTDAAKEDSQEPPPGGINPGLPNTPPGLEFPEPN